MELNKLEDLKVADLKAELQKRNLQDKGLKKELVARLKESLQTEQQKSEEKVESRAEEETRQPTSVVLKIQINKVQIKEAKEIKQLIEEFEMKIVNESTTMITTEFSWNPKVVEFVQILQKRYPQCQYEISKHNGVQSNQNETDDANISTGNKRNIDQTQQEPRAVKKIKTDLDQEQQLSHNQLKEIKSNPDKYFKKTITKPHIYYLPLSEDKNQLKKQI